MWILPLFLPLNLIIISSRDSLDYIAWNRYAQGCLKLFLICLLHRECQWWTCYSHNASNGTRFETFRDIDASYRVNLQKGITRPVISGSLWMPISSMIPKNTHTLWLFVSFQPLAHCCLAYKLVCSAICSHKLSSHSSFTKSRHGVTEGSSFCTGPTNPINSGYFPEDLAFWRASALACFLRLGNRVNKSASTLVSSESVQKNEDKKQYKMYAV